MELRVETDHAAVAEWVAERLLEACGAGRVLGLATGRTMEPVYGALARRWTAMPSLQRAALAQGWRSFNLDEYVGLAPHDPRSFHAFMQRHVVTPLALDPAQVRLPDGWHSDPEAAARRYGAELAAAGGVGLQLLGLGLNGHVGFNEPPCDAASRCRCLALSPSTRRQNAAAFGGDPTAVPARAITLGMAEILAAERVLLVVTGSAKAGVLGALLQGSPRPELPASWLQRHPAVTVVADRAAAPTGPD